MGLILVEFPGCKDIHKWGFIEYIQIKIHCLGTGLILKCSLTSVKLGICLLQIKIKKSSDIHSSFGLDVFLKYAILKPKKPLPRLSHVAYIPKNIFSRIQIRKKKARKFIIRKNAIIFFYFKIHMYL